MTRDEKTPLRFNVTSFAVTKLTTMRTFFFGLEGVRHEIIAQRSILDVSDILNALFSYELDSAV